jgi:hypothetical protein
MNTTENLKFDSAKFMFSRWHVYVEVYPRGEPEMYALSITVECWYLNQQGSFMAQISDSLSQIFSAVKHLTVEYDPYEALRLLFEEQYDVDRADWRKLLSSFSNVKTCHIGDEFVWELSHCLRSDGGELPLELLPELQELTYSGGVTKAFDSFIDARRNAGRPITLVHHSPD